MASLLHLYFPFTSQPSFVLSIKHLSPSLSAIKIFVIEAVSLNEKLRESSSTEDNLDFDLYIKIEKAINTNNIEIIIRDDFFINDRAKKLIYFNSLLELDKELASLLYRREISGPPNELLTLL